MKNIYLKEGYQFAILRVGIAVALLSKVIVEFGELDLMYSRKGILQDILARPLEISGSLTLRIVADFLHITDEHLFLNSIYILLANAAVLLLFGLQTRLCIFICLLIHLLVFNSYNLVAFGFDGFLFSLLFYALIFPVHKVYTLDAYLSKKEQKINPDQLRLYLRVLQIHLCIVYFTAGFSKLGGQEWMNGTAIWKAINQPQFYTGLTPLMKSIVSQPAVACALSWGTLFVETSFPLLIWIKYGHIRAMLLIGIMLMHLFIGAVLGLQLFAWIMITFDLTAFGNVLVSKNMLRSSPEPQPRPAAVQELPLCLNDPAMPLST